MTHARQHATDTATGLEISQQVVIGMAVILDDLDTLLEQHLDERRDMNQDGVLLLRRNRWHLGQQGQRDRIVIAQAVRTNVA
jgi:hypothetical protein